MTIVSCIGNGSFVHTGLKSLRDEMIAKRLVIEEALYVTIDERTADTNFKNVTHIVQKMVKNNSLSIRSSNSLIHYRVILFFK